ncbi:MAG TPA: phospholipase D-like domain-containing protein, partial [Thermoanaerobaculia bacterium]
VGIADEWLGDADAKNHWRETVVRIEGPAVTQLQFAFMDNWVKSRGELLTGLDFFSLVEPRGPHRTQVIKSSPTEGSSAVKLLYIVSIVSATKSIYISNAYFVPDRDTARALEGAVRRGVDVRVIVPGKYSDVPLARQASRMQYDLLLRRGIRIFEYQPTMMHAKTMVVDGTWSTIGSSNFDDRSFRLNDEVNVNVYDEGIAQQMEAMFFDDLARCEEVTLRKWFRRPRWSRIKEALANVLKPEL